MLYETFNSIKKSFGEDYFTSRINNEIIQNLNPKFELRDYQKEALGRFNFYFTEYHSRQRPVHLLFHMAAGSGKTLIMAANILQLYKQGYRNFIFFVNSINIIEKTRDNFLNTLSEKYLFAPKIKFDEEEIIIREVQNFQVATPKDINILFTTIQGMHTRLNNPKENAITYEDFSDDKTVLISDEAHHLQTLTKSKLNKSEEEEQKSWEYTVERILTTNQENILLEYTATIDLGNQNIKQKYEDKIIFQYDLRQFRLDKYSKEIEVLQADIDPMDRALQSVILSQYRIKIAEKNKIFLKPVVLFKSKSIKESNENYENFLLKIKNLKIQDIQEIESQTKGTDLEKAFKYFLKENISFENLIRELQEDFAKEKVMLLDSENINEEKQLKLNSLENVDNEIRAIFAVNMLNEGWDVLNLFDIVRLYDTRDGKWIKGIYKPGNTTMSEAQLIGRGARYYPFQLNETYDKYKRKFDDDIENEMRILETLHYHSNYNSKYIVELKSTLTEIGILPENYKEIEMNIKSDFKKSDFWNNGIIFLNKRLSNKRKDIFSLDDAKIEKEYIYDLKTDIMSQEHIIEDPYGLKSEVIIETIKKTFEFEEFGENVIRSAIDRIEFFKFERLKKYFPHLKSINEFITSTNYLGGIKVRISGPKNKINNLTQGVKLEIILDVLKKIYKQIISNTSDFIGSETFEPRLLKQIFRDKKIKISIDHFGYNELSNVDLTSKNWFAQTTFYGTDEEQKFITFIDGFIEKLRQKYSDIALLRNERFFQIFDFDEGRAFEPDFLMLLKNENNKIIIYQIFIEVKGDLFKDLNGKFDKSKEGWKQKFLLEIEKKAQLTEDLIMEMENKDFKLIGLPFYNEKMKKEFEEAFRKALEDEIL